jgi:cardiolipin synthase
MKHVPNILTVLRLAATPYVLFLVWQRRYGLAILLFIAVGLTDVADGFVARTFRAHSNLGALLDPIADKTLLSGTFLVLALTRAMDWWIAAIVLGRDAAILLGACFLYLSGSRKKFPPSAWGKASTLVQIVYVCFLMGTLAGIPVAAAALALQWLVAVLALISLLDYIRRAAQKPAAANSL